MEKDNKIKNKKNFIIIGVTLVIILIIIGAIYFINSNKEQTVVTDEQENNTNLDSNIANEASTAYEQPENTYTINWSTKEGDKDIYRLSQVSLNALEISPLQLNKVTLDKFIYTLNNNSDDCFSYSKTIEDTGFTGIPYINNDEFDELMDKTIPKGKENKISYYVHLQGALPRFDIEFSLIHPDYLNVDDPDKQTYVMDTDTQVRNWIVKGVRFTGTNVEKEEIELRKNNPSNYCKLDVLDGVDLLDKFKGETTDEITDRYIDTIERAMNLVYTGYSFTDEMEEELHNSMKYLLFEEKTFDKVPENFYYQADDLNLVYFYQEFKKHHLVIQ